MKVSLFHRGGFHVLKTAKAKSISQNAWTLCLPLSELTRVVWDPIELDTLDGKIFVLDDTETNNAVGHILNSKALHVTVWVP
jgi:hypothetical protein